MSVNRLFKRVDTIINLRPKNEMNTSFVPSSSSAYITDEVRSEPSWITSKMNRKKMTNSTKRKR